MLLPFIACCVSVLTGFVDPVTGTELFPYHSYNKIIDYDYKDNTCIMYAIQKVIIFFFAFSVLLMKG